MRSNLLIEPEKSEERFCPFQVVIGRLHKIRGIFTFMAPLSLVAKAACYAELDFGRFVNGLRFQFGATNKCANTFPENYRKLVSDFRRK